MTRKIRTIAVGATVALATLLPAAPASAGCDAGEPIVQEVVCGIGYSTVQSVSCKVARKLDPDAGCMT